MYHACTCNSCSTFNVEGVCRYACVPCMHSYGTLFSHFKLSDCMDDHMLLHVYSYKQTYQKLFFLAISIATMQRACYNSRAL